MDMLGQCPSGEGGQGEHHHRGRRRRQATKSRPASVRSRRRLRTPPPTTTREKLQERLAKLAGGVAVIQVGAATEVEMKEQQAAHRGRSGRHPRRRGRGHCAWRRHRPAERACPLWQSWLAKLCRRRQDRRADHRCALWKSPCARSRRTPVSTARVIVENVKNSPRKNSAMATTRSTSEYCGHDRARHHRSHQGHPFRAAERGVCGRHGADHRVPGGRHPRARTRGSRWRPLAWAACTKPKSKEQIRPAWQMPCGPFPVVYFIE